MKKSCIAILAATTVLCLIQNTHATVTSVIADWTFESTAPAGTNSVGPLAAEVGSGSAYAFGVNVISSPAGNGSSHSLSANGWAPVALSTNAPLSYYQFDVSTIGYSGIGITFDQASSSTGPADFLLQYSTDGATFTTFASYSPLVNGSPNPSWNATTASSLYTLNFDLSSIASLDNASTVDFRLLETGTTSENGGTVAAAGTDRVDNFIVGTVPAPEPTTLALCAIGGIAMLGLRRKR
jgi:hypothetical protein